MLDRVTAQTEVLQKQFPKTYRDFFAICQRVASASNSFLWTGEFSGFYGGLTVSQKLPIRSYVGLETTFDNQVTVNREYQTFDAEKQQFITAIADDRLCDNVQRYLVAYYKRDTNFTGVRVHLLTEIPLGHSLGSNGAIVAALALLLTGEGDFEATYTTARNIMSLSQAGHSSGVSVYTALTDKAGPIVFFSENDTFYAKSIEEVADVATSLIWPIDFGLIYSGAQTNAEGVILANNETVNELETDTQRLDQLFGGALQLNFRQTYIDMLNMTASLTVMSLSELFAKGTKHAVLEQFFNSLNQFQNLLHILHVSNGATDLIYSRIHQLANKQVNDVGSGVKISGIGKGGAVLFAVPYGTHRAAIVEMIEQLRQETGRPIWLDYASWIDGIGGQPGSIEQDIQRGKQSAFIGRDALSLTVLTKGTLRQQVVTSERFAELVSDIDLLLDKTTGKITIAGQPLTSKDVVSQKATVTIIDRLIREKSFTLKNEQLPSSYGTSRYDLQGKIVMPLVRCVKQLTGRDLQLSIAGGMYDGYSLTLDPSNIIIAIVESKA